ncbi:hypothetical protein D3Z60_08140 [Lachnospiraceae bacterium]|jgi:hypothetical protein|nr:hypothetical protein [Lachnospiraceae bacterium]
MQAAQNTVFWRIYAVFVFNFVGEINFSLPLNRNVKAHKENALVERKKDGTALVIGAIPPNLKLLPYHRKP